jgi:hypothetical protein
MHAFSPHHHHNEIWCTSTTMGSIEDALAAIALEEKPKYSATATEYDVDRTTLSRRHRGVTTSRAEARNIRSLLTTQQEKELVNYINKLTTRGLPPTLSMVRNFAQDICQILSRKSWVHRFVKRHKDQLISGFLSGQDLNRKKADNIYQYERYFDLVQSLIPLRFSANMCSLLRKFPNTISSHTTPIIWMRKASWLVFYRRFKEYLQRSLIREESYLEQVKMIIENGLPY